MRAAGPADRWARASATGAKMSCNFFLLLLISLPTRRPLDARTGRDAGRLGEYDATRHPVLCERSRGANSAIAFARRPSPVWPGASIQFDPIDQARGFVRANVARPSVRSFVCSPARLLAQSTALTQSGRIDFNRKRRRRRFLHKRPPPANRFGCWEENLSN